MKYTTLIATLLLAAVPLSAQPSADPGQPAQPRTEQPRQGDELGRFAQKHNLSRGDLDRLRQEGMSWSDIGCAAWLAERSKRPMTDVVDEHRAGASWDDIAKRHELDASRMHRGARQFRHEAMQAERAGPHEGRHGMERGDHDRMMERDHDRDMRHDQSHGEDQPGGPRR